MTATTERDYDALLDRLEEELAAANASPLTPWARRMVKSWRRELAAEPNAYRVQAAIVELANALGVREPQ